MIDIELQMRGAGLPAPEKEFRFAPGRKFRFDYCYPDKMIAIEKEGGIFASHGGGHRSISGLLRDVEKYNLATLHGWKVYRITPNMIANGSALALIEKALR
jgi:hypothetical protein